MSSAVKLGLPVRRLRRNSIRSFSSSVHLHHTPYANTLDNLRIGSHTQVIFQGFTGRQATANAQESIAWGTNIVGGVTPGREGEHLGLPVLPSVRRAMEELKPDATGIYVAAHQATAAIEEAIEAEVPLIVAVAEHIPLHDMLRIHSILKTQDKSRLVGANSPGIISAVGKCRIGFQPLPCFSPGRIGIIAKSGTLSYEAVASTTRAGLGQSLCVGVGGDILPGTDMIDAFRVLENDADTDAIVLIGEIGGFGELEITRAIKQYNRYTLSPKPIVALIAGVNVVPGRVMGHAGAFLIPGEPSAKEKIAALEDVGVTIVNHPSKFGEALKKRLEAVTLQSSNQSATFPSPTMNGAAQQQRGMHNSSRRPRRCLPGQFLSHHQTRSLHLGRDACKMLLQSTGKGKHVSFDNEAYWQSEDRDANTCYLAISIDRTKRVPCIVTARVGDALETVVHHRFRKHPFDGELMASSEDFTKTLNLPESFPTGSVQDTIKDMIAIFEEKEAFHLQMTYDVEKQRGGSAQLEVLDASFDFDDAAFRSGGRQAELYNDPVLMNAGRDAAEVEAQKHGIVYAKLPGDGKIGTLVNGAGLAMNTVDALADAGGKAANFLDTGGKATSNTVKKSFELILKDSRVKVIFVNIFGGLTLGDMIARGVIQAFKEVEINVPVVVRIRGTNETEGQKIIADSGLPLFAFDDFDEAAAKAIELSNQE